MLDIKTPDDTSPIAILMKMILLEEKLTRFIVPRMRQCIYIHKDAQDVHSSCAVPAKDITAVGALVRRLQNTSTTELLLT